jgi:hypothetical protein
MRLEEDTFAPGHQLRLRRSFLMEPSALTGLSASHIFFAVLSPFKTSSPNNTIQRVKNNQLVLDGGHRQGRGQGRHPRR